MKAAAATLETMLELKLPAHEMFVQLSGRGWGKKIDFATQL